MSPIEKWWWKSASLSKFDCNILIIFFWTWTNTALISQRHLPLENSFSGSLWRASSICSKDLGILALRRSITWKTNYKPFWQLAWLNLKGEKKKIKLLCFGKCLRRISADFTLHSFHLLHLGKVSFWTEPCLKAWKQQESSSLWPA